MQNLIYKTSINLDGNFDLEYILKKIRLLGFSRILLESGLNLTSNFLNKDLIDDFKLFVSSKKIKANGRNSFKSNMKSYLSNKKSIIEKVNLLGDKLITYRMK